MPAPIVLLNADAIQRALTRVAHEIVERNPDNGSVVIIGVQRGGVRLARRLADFLQGIWKHPIPVGLVDVSMHRDDLDQRLSPEMHPTTIPFDISEKIVVLADDVLCSGRTIRAAMDALNDFGRPKSIQLAVVIDRGHRELPIKATYVGKNVPTALQERINVKWKEDGGEDGVLLERA